MNIVYDISNGQEPYPISLVYDNIDELEELKREHQKVNTNNGISMRKAVDNNSWLWFLS